LIKLLVYLTSNIEFLSPENYYINLENTNMTYRVGDKALELSSEGGYCFIKEKDSKIKSRTV